MAFPTPKLTEVNFNVMLCHPLIYSRITLLMTKTEGTGYPVASARYPYGFLACSPIGQRGICPLCRPIVRALTGWTAAGYGLGYPLNVTGCTGVVHGVPGDDDQLQRCGQVFHNRESWFEVIEYVPEALGCLRAGRVVRGLRIHVVVWLRLVCLASFLYSLRA